MDWSSTKPEDFPQALLLLAELPQLVRNKIFARWLDNYVSTLPKELSSRKLKRAKGEGEEAGTASHRLLTGTPSASPYCHRLSLITQCYSLCIEAAF